MGTEESLAELLERLQLTGLYDENFEHIGVTAPRHIKELTVDELKEAGIKLLHAKLLVKVRGIIFFKK